MSDKADTQCRRLTSVTFREPIMFAGSQVTHFAVREGDVGKLDKMAPAVLLPSGDWAAIDKGQHASGVGLERFMQRGSERRIERCFVPFANINCLTYAP